MHQVIDYIERAQAEFASHAFFERLRNSDSIEIILPMARHLTFWVFTFQDILRLNWSRTSDPDLVRIARHHLAEDAGHQLWFLKDLELIEGTLPGVEWIFSEEHAQTRAASFAIASEVFRVVHDYDRIVILLTLESAGHIFFAEISSYFEAQGIHKALRYFAKAHLEAEKSHELFERQMMERLLSVTLSPDDRSRSIALVQRLYDAFRVMFDAIDSALERTPIQSAHCHEGRLLRRESELLGHVA
jgi:hypothetical protein